MKKQTNNNLIYRILEYGYFTETFTLRQLQEALNIDESTLLHIQKIYVAVDNTIKNELLIIRISDRDKNGNHINDRLKCIYRLLPSALFQYLEFVELEEARNTAQHSKIIAWIAIGFSLFVGGLQILAQFLLS